MIDYVVVIRTKQGDDLLALLCGEVNDVVKIEHPYYVKFNPATSNLAVIPYCPLTDEKFFELKRNDIEFLVTANRDISAKFIRMVDAAELVVTAQEKGFLEEEEQYDEIEAGLNHKNFVEGNDTKH